MGGRRESFSATTVGRHPYVRNSTDRKRRKSLVPFGSGLFANEGCFPEPDQEAVIRTAFTPDDVVRHSLLLKLLAHDLPDALRNLCNEIRLGSGELGKNS